MNLMMFAWAGVFGLLAADAFRKRVSRKTAEQIRGNDAIRNVRHDQSSDIRLQATVHDRKAGAIVTSGIPYLFTAVSATFVVGGFIFE